MFSGIGTGEQGIEQAYRRRDMYRGTVTFHIETETEEEADIITQAITNAVKAIYPDIDDADLDVWEDGEE